MSDAMKNEFLIRRLEKSIAESPSNVQARYELGRLYEEEGLFERAVRELEKALQLQPLHAPTLFELGVVYTRMQGYDNAITSWKRLTDEDGDLNLEGLDYSRQATMQNVHGLWEHYRQQRPDSAVVSYNLGFALMVLGRTEEATLELERALTLNPRFEGANYLLALIWRRKARAQVVADYLQREIEVRPAFANAWYQLGLTTLRMGQRPQAVGHLQKALQLKPGYVKALFHLALVYASQSQWTQAIEMLEKTLEVRPTFHEALFQLGQIHERQYRMEEAAKVYERAVKVHPRYKEAHFHLGLVQKTLGRLEAASHSFQAAADLDPLDAEAYYYLGLTAYQRGLYAEAAQNHERALEASPNHAYASYTLGQAYMKLGRTREAIDAYRHGLEQNPRDAQTRNALGVALVQNGEIEDAVREFEIVLEQNPRDSEAHYFLGAALFKLQRLDRAIEQYSTVATIDPESPYAHFALGATYSRSGDYDRAVSEYSRASSKMNATSESDLTLFSTLQLLAAIGIEHAAQASRLQVTVKQVEEVYMNTIKALTQAMDARDSYTRFHSSRVSRIAQAFARFLQLTPDEVRAIEMGGYMHDIGKIGVPDFVLRKEGKLTEEERWIIEQHPTIGFDMLKDLPLPWLIQPIVRFHHERWDGSGYPDGLKGREIPRDAQIVSISDFWDALSTARPYKPALPPEQCLEIICKQSGVHFDPEVLEVFTTGFLDELLLIP